MEEAAELGNYLPLSFKTPKEQEYIEFLWDAFETNYTQWCIIESSHCEEGGPPFGEYIYPEDYGEFNKAMTKFIKGFIIAKADKKSIKSKDRLAK